MKLNKYNRIAKEIVKLLPSYAELTDEELKAKTPYFKEQIANGKKPDSMLPDIFCTIIEADTRVLGLTPYYVQIVGGLALYYGNIAEMKTGEGKTLVATLPLYARAVEGKGGNFLVTVNDYLAYRDATETGKVFEWLGLTLGIGASPEDESDVEDQDDDKKLKIYGSDIVYTTNSALGFDYLIDNLETELERQCVNRFNFVIIDEIDAILLDGAQTALIISGAPKLQSNLFQLSDWFIKSLTKDDYDMSEDEKSVWFTEEGIKKAEAYFGIDGLLTEKWTDHYRHLVLALHANFLRIEGRAYVVDNGEVFLLDEVNGREMEGVKLQGGNHQAIEAKEGVDITDETKSMGSITYQNLFKKFRVLSGMTGTAKTDAFEFKDTFNLDVIVIPTNKPSRRKDYDDKIFVTNRSKLLSSLDLVKDLRDKGQPVLIETGSVTLSRLYSLILLQHRIPHNLLNATTAAKESKIVAEAGKKGAITVATAMAGRGTDIKLEKEAKDLGGLVVLGTERMTSARIDNQFKGRAGRQGEPGESHFYTSLEDLIVIQSAPKWVRKSRQKYKEKIENGEMESKLPLTDRKFKKVIRRTQQSIGSQEVQSRKSILENDEIISIQREKIYKSRNIVMRGDVEYLDDILTRCITKTLDKFLGDKSHLNRSDISDFIYNNIDMNFDAQDLDGQLGEYRRRTVYNYLETFSRQKGEETQGKILSDFQLLYFKKVIVLKAIDAAWVDQLDRLQQLKAMISGRDLGQHKPINEFQIEARRSFFDMEDEIWLNIFKNLMLSDLKYNKDGSIAIDFP